MIHKIDRQLIIIFVFSLFFRNTIYTQQFIKTFSSGETTYEEVKKGNNKYYYDTGGERSIGQDTLDPHSDWEKFRSKYRFNISEIPSSAKIISVICQYVVSPTNLSRKFSITHYKPDGTETDKESWQKIKSSSVIKNGLSYNTGNFTDADLTAIIESEITSDGIFYLGAFSEYETLAQTQANVIVELEIHYEIVKLTVENDMTGWHGGHIGVGINTSSYSSKSSPFLTPVLSYGNTIKLHAYEDNSYGGYSYIWNDTEAPSNKSIWSKEDGKSGHDVPNKTLQTTSYSVVKEDGGAKLIANLRKICNVTQKYEFTEGGTSGTVNTTTRIEGNTITLTASPTKTANGLTGYFSGWKEDPSTNTTITRTINEHSTFTAQYKAIARSNNINAYKNNGQRKIVRAENGTLFRVYESINKIWLEKSTNGGSTWVLANNHSPISHYTGSSTTIASKPSMGISPHNDEPNKFVLAVCYILSTPNNKDALWVVRIDENGNILTDYTGKYEKQLFYANIQLGEPVIAVNYEGRIGIALKRTDALWYYLLDKGLVQTALEQIPNTNNSSSHPTLTADVLNFHLAWQQASSSSSNIKYTKITQDYMGENVSFSAYTDVSYNPGYYEENAFPSITNFCEDQRPTIAWINTDEDWVTTQVQVRTKNSGTNWGTKTTLTEYSYGEQISASVNTLTDDINDNEYMVGYAAASDKVAYYLPEEGEFYLYPNNTSDYVQVSNGEEGWDTPFISFNTNSNPYVFHTTTIDDGNLSKSNKKTKGLVGRELLITNGINKMKLKIEAPRLDGVPINFVKIDDTTLVKTKEEALALFTTEEFKLTDKSELLFDLKYLVTDKSKENKEETDESEIKLNVVLLDAESKECLSDIKEVTSENATKKDKEGLEYKVNAEDIGSRTVRLTVELDPKKVDNITIVKTSNLERDNLKKEQVEVTINKEMIVTDYALYQNYPNPFNPTTTISYQIPQEGKVTIKVYDSIGKEVATLVNEEKQRGRYSVTFDASGLTSGIYFYSLTSGKYKETKKLILLK